MTPAAARPVGEGTNVGALMSRLGAEAGTLIRQEVRLATVEMTEKAAAAGRHGAVMAVGALVSAVSFMTLTAALVVGLGKVMEIWTAALVVGLALAVVGYGVVRSGVASLRQMSPTPTRTLATWKESRSWAQALVR